jgi:hypothetical protein
MIETFEQFSILKSRGRALRTRNAMANNSLLLEKLIFRAQNKDFGSLMPPKSPDPEKRPVQFTESSSLRVNPATAVIFLILRTPIRIPSFHTFKPLF